MASPLGQFAPFTVEHIPGAANGHSEASEKPLVQGVLELEVHQAKGLHNICIYAKQDVYAKLMITGAGAGAAQETFFTEIVDKGGKDPVFNQKFTAAVVPSDSVLRCEVYMASKMRDYLQDQLLGLVSVPVSGVVGAGRVFNEYGLSSTELFHAPSGSISLTMEFLEDDGGTKTQSSLQACNSATSNLSSENDLGIESKAVEFTDPADAREDEELVSDFIRRASKKQNVEGGAKEERIFTGPPYLKLKQDEHSYSGEEQSDEHSVAPGEGGEKPSLKVEVAVSTSSSLPESSVTTNGLTPSSKVKPAGDGVEFRVEVEPEPRIVQEEIMDMYMKSMQQFSEALAKMQLPVDENGMIKLEESGETSSAPIAAAVAAAPDPIAAAGASSEVENVMSKKSSSSESGGDPKKGSQKVFYGSRAFF